MGARRSRGAPGPLFCRCPVPSRDLTGCACVASGRGRQRYQAARAESSRGVRPSWIGRELLEPDRRPGSRVGVPGHAELRGVGHPLPLLQGPSVARLLTVPSRQRAGSYSNSAGRKKINRPGFVWGTGVPPIRPPGVCACAVRWTLRPQRHRCRPGYTPRPSAVANPPGIFQDPGIRLPWPSLATARPRR
jgi:hypothetical protein